MTMMMTVRITVDVMSGWWLGLKVAFMYKRHILNYKKKGELKKKKKIRKKIVLNVHSYNAL